MQESPLRDRFPIVLPVILGASILRLWIQPLGNSFWLDETLTAWTVSGDLKQVLSRAFFNLQSVTFCFLEWLTASVGGHREVVLRLPSVAAAIATLYLLYRMGVEVFDTELGLTFAALYAAFPSLVVEVPNARPYAVAVFVHIGALFFLLRWLRSGNSSNGAWWGVLSATACHVHILFAISIPLEVAVILWCRRRNGTIKLHHVGICTLLLGALLVPAIPQALIMSKLGRALSFAGLPSVTSLLFALIPVAMLTIALPVAAAQWAGGRSPGWSAAKWGTEVRALGALLLIFPTVGIFLLSRFTPIRIFESRYLLPAAPGFILFWGAVIRGIEPSAIRRLSLVGALAVAVFGLGGLRQGVDFRGEDWRSAVRSLPDSGATLVYCGLVETRRLDWLQDPQRWGYLAAPMVAYRPEISRQDVLLIPYEFELRDRAYVQNRMTSLLREHKIVSIISRRVFFAPAWVSWLSQCLVDSGFEVSRSSAYGLVEVRIFHPKSHE